MDNQPIDKVIRLVLDLFKVHPTLKEITDLAGLKRAKFQLLADMLTADLKSTLYTKETDYVSGKGIQDLIKQGIRPHGTVHDRLAGAWLYYNLPEKWSLDKIQERFNNAYKTKKDYFWIRYVAILDAYITPENPEPVIPKETLLPQEGKLVRYRYLKKLQKLRDKQFVVIIEGITGSGKTEMVTGFKEEALRTYLHDHVIEPIITKDYSFDTFFRELNITESTNHNLSPGVKVNNVLRHLKTENALLILDDFEKADESSFAPFIEAISHTKGRLHVVIVHNEKFKSLSTLPRNIIRIAGYNFEEFVSLLNCSLISMEPDAIDLLLEKTEGIPQAVEIFLDLVSSSYLGMNEKIKKLIDEPDYRDWIEKIIDELPELPKKFLFFLSLIEGDFSLDVVYTSGIAIGIEDPQKAFDLLTDKLLIRKTSSPESNEFNIFRPICEYVDTLPLIHEREQHHLILAEIFWKFTAFRTKKDFENTELRRIIAAAYHLQRARKFHYAENYLTRSLKFLKRYGKYQDILSLTSYAILHDNERNNWVDWENAHSYFITGQLETAYSAIVKLIKRHFTALDKSKDSYDTMVAKTIKYLQLYCEILEQLGRPDLAIAILQHSLRLFNISDYDWDIRSHAVSILSWLKFKSGYIDEAIDISKDLLNDIELPVRGKAIAYTRLGIFNLKKGSLHKAIENLEEAYTLYNSEVHKDQRALAWCSFYLALGSYDVHENDNGSKFLQDCLEFCNKIKLYDSDYRILLPTFNTYPLGEELKRLLNEVMVRLNKRFAAITEWFNQHKVDSDFADIRALFVGKQVKDFDYKELLKPFDYTPKAIKSRASRSLINRARKVPESTIENIFKRKQDISKIFTCHFYNKLITELLKEVDEKNKQKVIDHYIVPNLDFILQHPDSKDKLKFHYARALEYAHDTNNALILLDKVAERNWNFEYYIIKGNCYKYRSFEISYELYKKAETLAYWDKEKGRICNNIAMLIYDRKRKEKYEEAKNLCEAAREYWKVDYKKSFYPITTLILIEIEEAELGTVISNTRLLVDKYNLNEKQLFKIFEKVIDHIKRSKLIQAFCKETSAKSSLK